MKFYMILIHGQNRMFLNQNASYQRLERQCAENNSFLSQWVKHIIFIEHRLEVAKIIFTDKLANSFTVIDTIKCDALLIVNIIKMNVDVHVCIL